MEKRNFVTSVRTTDGSSYDDAMLKSAADMFSGKRDATDKGVKDLDDFVKKASAEDEKSDRSL